VYFLVFQDVVFLKHIRRG